MSLLQRLLDFLGSSATDDDPVAQLPVARVFSVDGIGVRLREFKHPSCGHAGFIAEFYDPTAPEIPVAILGEIGMQEAHQLLSRCLEFVELRHRQER